MRRKLVAVTAFLCLFAAGAAYAAEPVTGGPNTYTGSYTAHGKGSAAKPVPVSMVEQLGMGSTTSGNVGAPLVDIKSTVTGVKNYAQYFPKCTAGQINGSGASSGKWNAVCPKGSLIASGTVQAALVSSSANLAGPGSPCLLHLWGYNGGVGKVTFFFTTNPAQCDGLSTGAAAAWTGTSKQSGSKWINDVPEPADVSYNAGNLNGSLFGSLQSETLNWKKVTVKHGGKTYPYLASIGCKGSRSYSIKYTATTSATVSAASSSSGTVTGKSGC
ncbi:MAG TPA: hypothetical protein VHV75_19890 [Solirubrobacteraceae bacterium]|nr:hypothetical protein [Solirubrobacteraceae bacterium]